jgi:hypothetical protein
MKSNVSEVKHVNSGRLEAEKMMPVLNKALKNSVHDRYSISLDVNTFRKLNSTKPVRA